MQERPESRLRILYLQYANPWNPFSHAGLPYANHEILKRLSRRHHVEVWTGRIPNGSRMRTHEGVIYRDCSRGANKFTNRFTYTAYILIKKIVGYDIVVIPWTRYSPVFPKAKGIPVILEAHSDFFHVPPKLPLLEPLAVACYKRQLSRSPYLIAVSNLILDNILQHKKVFRETRVIYNGIDQDLLDCQPESSAGNASYLLFIGRLDIKVKGVDTLLRVYKRSGVGIPLKIAGDGLDKTAIENLIREEGLQHNVELTGWVNGKEKHRLLAESLAVLIPSREEGWGLVAMEAAAAGKPAIASRVGGLQEAVVDKETGFLIAAENIDQWTAAVKDIVENPDLRQRLGENARKRALQFTWEKSAAERENFFKTIVEKA